MTILYTTSIRPFLTETEAFDENQFANYKECLPESRLEKVARLRSPKDKARSAMAGVLLLRAYREYKKDEKSLLPEIVLTDREKPVFLGEQEIHFNLSHSGDYVACVISDAPVGVDIQERRELKEHFIKRIFSEKEKQYDSSVLMDFYAFKEAYVKYTGEGMARKFGDLSMENLYEIGTDFIDGKTVYGRRICENKGYALAVVSENPLKEMLWVK